MKGIGNYRSAQAAPSTERRVAKVALYIGPRASIQFLDGSMQTLPALPFRTLNIPEGGRFILLVTRQGRSVVDVRVELMGEARPALAPRGPGPKVMVRDGMKTTTRR